MTFYQYWLNIFGTLPKIVGMGKHNILFQIVSHVWGILKFDSLQEQRYYFSNNCNKSKIKNSTLRIPELNTIDDTGT